MKSTATGLGWGRSDGNPYRTSILDASVAPWDFAAQSARNGRLAQESVWDSNASSARAAASLAEQQGGAQQQALANKNELFGMARGRATQLANDPVDALVLKALQERSGANAGPYDATTRNAMFTQQAEMAAAAQQNQMGGIRGNVADPAYQARVAELQGQRQQSLQGARLGIDLTANRANYDARGQALGQLGTFNQVHNGAVTDAQRYLGGLLRDEVFNDESQSQTGGLPSYAQYSAATLGGGGSVTPFRGSQAYTAPVGTSRTTNVNPLLSQAQVQAQMTKPKPAQYSNQPAPKLTAGTTNWTTGQNVKKPASTFGSPMYRPTQF